MRLTLCFIFLILVSTLVEADTLYLASHRTVNGLVTMTSSEKEPDKFSVRAKFRDNVTKNYNFERSDVEKIEINKTEFNQGAPPPWINKYEGTISQNVPAFPSKSSNAANPPQPEETELSKLPETRFPTHEPYPLPTPLPSMIDNPGIIGSAERGVSVSVIKFTDEITFTDNSHQLGRLALINADTIKLKISGGEIITTRNNVQTIIVGH